MAVEVITWVFAQSRSRNGQRLVMLAVADACNSPDGTGAWLSNAALQSKTGLSERAVRVAIRECEELGELKVDVGRGRGGVNRFMIVMSQNPADSAPLPQNPADSAGADSAPPENAKPQAKPQNPAESAGQQAARKPAVSAPGTVGTSSSSGNSSSRGERSKAARGTRIPDDFHATPEMIDWARSNTPNVGAAETEQFIDHFRSAPGQKGVKVDWIAAWKVWMRREQKRYNEQLARELRYAESRNGKSTNSSKPIPPDQKCPKHPSYHRDRCGPCRSERGARTTNDTGSPA